MLLSEFHREPNENEHQFIWRIGEAKTNGLLNANWIEIANVINQEWRGDENEYRNESAYRKVYTAAKDFYNDVFANYQANVHSTEEMQGIIRELEKARVKLRDERIVYNQDIRIQARMEQKLDFLGELLEKTGESHYALIPTKKNAHENSDNTLVVVLSDWHLGAAFFNGFGEYNVKIAKERLNKLILEVGEIGARHNAKRCYLAVVGDTISGNIHTAIKVTNRENVIEQVQTATELLADVVYQLAFIFDLIEVHGTVGNHSRIDRKEDALKDERLDQLVLWMTGKLTHHLNNVSVLAHPCDNTLDVMMVQGKSYVISHGDYDTPSMNALAKLSTMLGFIPYAVITGHKHYPMMTEFNGVKWVQGGSLGGSGDDFTVAKRLTSKAGQTVLVCNNKGIVCEYPLVLE